MLSPFIHYFHEYYIHVDVELYYYIFIENIDNFIISKAFMYSTFKSCIKWIFIVYLILCSAIWFASPFVADKYIKEFLIEHKLTLSDTSRIYYNPFTHHLSIEDLALYEENKETPSVSLDSLHFELHLHQLILDNVHIAEFDISGLDIAVEITEAGYTVAGFVIPANTSAHEDTPDITENVEAESEEPVPYQLVLPRFNLSDSNVHIDFNGNSHAIGFDHFSLSDIRASLNKQSLQLTIDSTIDNAPFNVNIDGELLNKTGEISVDVSLSKLGLSKYQYLLPNEDDIVDGELTLDIKSVIKLLPNELLTINIHQYLFELNQLHLASQGQQVKIGEQLFTGKNATFTYTDKTNNSDNDVASTVVSNTTENPSNAMTFNANARYELKALKVFLTDENAQLLSLSNFSLPLISVMVNDKEQTVELQTINVNGVVASDRIEDEILPMATLSSVDIDYIKASPLGVAIGNILIGEIAVNAEINEEQAIINLLPLPASEPSEDIAQTETSEPTSPDNEASTQETTDEPLFNIALNSLALSSPTTVQFIDKSVTPHFERDLVINTLTVNRLDSEEPSIPTDIKLTGTTGKYGKLDFTTIVTPFAEIPVYHVNGFFNEFDLTGVSSYIRDALGIEIENGEFDLALDTKVTGSELSGDAEVFLRRFEFTGVKSTTNSKNVNAISFNAALGTLKDSDGNVELNLPLSGDISDPSFGLSGLLTLVVKKAVLSKAKDFLVNTFVPYAGIVSVAVSAGEFALKIRVEDLLFIDAIDTLGPEHTEFIEAVAGLLNTKEDLKFKLCAYSTPADIGLPLGSKITVQDQITQLNAISTKRVESLKDYLVEQHGIASSRLSICKNQIDMKKDAKPRITFDS